MQVTNGLEVPLVADAERDSITKHEQILKYIGSLKIGSKISVRQTAKQLDVSEGTAYRAIKEAESQGLVETRERIGTVRVEKKPRMEIHRLTFEDVVNIVDGHVLGGEQGLDKSLIKFVIGAMEEDAMKRYIEAGSLLIVGNRYEAHAAALELGAGVLVTGGFDTTEEARRLANRLALPIVSSSYDTFTVASLINRAIYDSLIKKKIMIVEDILIPRERVHVLKTSSTLSDWHELLGSSGHTRFPVVDEWNRVVGIITGKDVFGAEPATTVDKLMTRNPLAVSSQMSIASAAHMMVWEGIELLPVIDGSRKLLGVVSRRDVLKAMQSIQRQPQIGETLDDLILTGFEEAKDEEGRVVLRGTVTPQMTNKLGTVSEGVLTTLMAKAASRAIEQHKKGDLVIENMTTYFVRPLQIDSEIEVRPRIIEISRKFGKSEVDIVHDGSLVCKAMLTVQLIEQQERGKR